MFKMFKCNVYMTSQKKKGSLVCKLSVRKLNWSPFSPQLSPFVPLPSGSQPLLVFVQCYSSVSLCKKLKGWYFFKNNCKYL